MVRSLFLKIFLWFWAAQLLLGVALYALAVATQGSPEEMLRSGAGDSLEAWGRANAITYELGGKPALRAAWRDPLPSLSGPPAPPDLGPSTNTSSGPPPAPSGSSPSAPGSAPGGAPPGELPGSRSGVPPGMPPGAPSGDSLPPGGPEDRSRACLYLIHSSSSSPSVQSTAPRGASSGRQASASGAAAVGAPATSPATSPASELVLLAGPPPEATARPIVAQAARDGQASMSDEDGGSWIARRVQTSGGGRYVVAVKLRPPFRRFQLFRAWDGPGPGPSPALQFLVVAGIMGAVCYALARYITAPAVKLGRATQMFAQGDLSARVGPHMGRRRDELADLGRDFDRMAEHIQSLIGAERRLLGDISHELRSPLARMQVALDLVQGTVEGEACKYLERIERESHRLNELIGQLLTLSRLESDVAPARSEPIDLDALLAEVAADADFEARSRHRAVAVIEAQPCHTVGDAALLRSAIENVLRNAARYTPEGTRVEVLLRHESRGSGKSEGRDGGSSSLGSSIGEAGAPAASTGEAPPSAFAPPGAVAVGRRAGEQAVIRVRDYGPGVPAESLERLFDSFYRVEHARDRQSGGVGLGLSITARAVRLHGGEVAAMNAPEGGLLVEIRLPLAQ